MSKPVLNEYQPSMTEWFAAIGRTAESEAFRAEDGTKADRLETLYQTIGLPYARPIRFEACALKDGSQDFLKLLEQRGDKLCAIRLVPKTPDLPKIRNRGLTLRECYETWFLKQDIHFDSYVAYVCPHTDGTLWSAIFVVSDDAIVGEVVRGMHHQLTQGNMEGQSAQFRFDFENWRWRNGESDARAVVARMIQALFVPDPDTQRQLRRSLNARFSHNYLWGYFENTVWPDNTLDFIDYNQFLGSHIPSLSFIDTHDHAAVHGMPASSGVARGPVVIVDEKTLSTVEFPDGGVLVCDNTDVRYLPFMRKAAAMVTNRGGMFSHASLVARELKIPCIVGTKNATEILRTGDIVEVDATVGTVRSV